MNNKIILFFSICIFQTSCILFKKEIKKPITLYVENKHCEIELTQSSYNTKYIPYCGASSIMHDFMDGFKLEAKKTENVSLRINENSDSAEYFLVIKKIIAEEKEVQKDVKDGEVEIKGVLLTNFSMRVVAELRIKTSTVRIYPIDIMDSKEEFCTNKKGLGDYDYGISKDGKQYRYKRLDDYICLKLAEKLGRRIWVPITRKIAKNLN